MLSTVVNGIDMQYERTMHGDLGTYLILPKGKTKGCLVTPYIDIDSTKATKRSPLVQS